MALFGSQVTGAAGAMSDTDIAALSDHPLSLTERGMLTEEVARTRGVNEDTVDLIDLWYAPPLLAHEVAQHGVLLEGAPADFLRFKVHAWKRYLDTAKFRRIRAEHLDRIYGTRPAQ